MSSHFSQTDREEGALARYACRSSQSRGRVHLEDSHRLRTEFQRDRDRIIHSRAFRRLEYKTQVFVNSAGDHFRTRLTHTIEVSGIARTLARCLGLNEDLAETIALAHDLGHTPFGHCGERALNNLLADHGGFDHNSQALKVVDELEQKYPRFPGLNLTWEVRSGLTKHRGAEPPKLDGEPLTPQPILEGQVANVADDLTYLSHDLDDGISAGLLHDDDLEDIAIWSLARQRIVACNLAPGDECYFPFMIRTIIDMLVEDVIEQCVANLASAGAPDPQAAMDNGRRLIEFSDAFRLHGEQMRRFLNEKFYWHPAVDDDNQTAVKWMCALYQHFVEHPDTLGRKAQARIATVGLEIATADYIASMTDRYAIDKYWELVGGNGGME